MDRPASRARSAFRKLFSEYSYLFSFLLVLIIAIVAYAQKDVPFFTSRNLTNIFVQSAPTGIIALGMLMVICAGQIDISVGAQVAIISGTGIAVLNMTGSIALMLLYCLLLGLLIGTVNGLLIAKGRMPAMVATLATQIICRSLVNHIGQGGPFAVDKAYYDSFRMVAAGSLNIGPLSIQYPILMLIGFSLLFGLIMQRTKLGKHIYAVGSNPLSARLAGINVDGVKIIVFALTGLLCGFSGWLYASRTMAVAASNAGNLYEMDAIAAVAIGGASMSGGRGKVTGTFLGIIMFNIIDKILTVSNVPTFLNGAIKGAIIIVAVLIQNLQGYGPPAWLDMRPRVKKA